MGFVTYLWSNLLISLYHNSGRNAQKRDTHDSPHCPPNLWDLLISSATAHYGDGSTEAKVDDYQALPSATRTDDSIELGRRPMHSTDADIRTVTRPVFDADLEARAFDDDGNDSYWERDDLADDDQTARESRFI